MASWVYALLPPLPVSLTVMVSVLSSAATVTKIVLPTATFTADTLRVVPLELSLAVPMAVAVWLIPLRTARLRAGEVAETFPATSVAVAVMLRVPGASVVAVRPEVVYAAAVPVAT